MVYMSISTRKIIECKLCELDFFSLVFKMDYKNISIYVAIVVAGMLFFESAIEMTKMIKNKDIIYIVSTFLAFTLASYYKTYQGYVGSSMDQIKTSVKSAIKPTIVTGILSYLISHTMKQTQKSSYVISAIIGSISSEVTGLF